MFQCFFTTAFPPRTGCIRLLKCIKWKSSSICAKRGSRLSGFGEVMLFIHHEVMVFFTVTVTLWPPMGTVRRVYTARPAERKNRGGKEPADAAFGVRTYRSCVCDGADVSPTVPSHPFSLVSTEKRQFDEVTFSSLCMEMRVAVIWPPTSPSPHTHSHTHTCLFSAQAERWGSGSSPERLFWLARLLYVCRKCVPPRQFPPFKWEVRLNLVVVEVVDVNTLDRLND